MRIAILMTNTDDSGFADQWPLDDEKVEAMMRLARPGWDYPVWRVCDGVFPESLEGLDGAIITGSPASVNAGADWMARLEALIRQMVAEGVPLYGVCFGHQAIARALGGKVGKNPGGWVFGTVEAEAKDGARRKIYASHSEQVLALPEGAQVVERGPGCEVAGFVVGGKVLTTQYHPEMEPEFIAALVEHLAGELGPEVTTRARASLSDVPDIADHAEGIARFFETAAG